MTRWASRPRMASPGFRVWCASCFPPDSMPARTALVILVAIQGACAAGIVPPSLTEVGSTVIAGDGRMDSGLRVSTGTHLASGQTARDRNLDVGAGVVYERLAAPAAGSESRALGGAAPMDAGEAPEAIEARGSYIDAAAVVQRAGWHRTWIGARTELMRQEGPDGGRAVGATFARVSWETYAPVKAAGADTSGSTVGAGFAYGAFAMGLFVESGVRYAEGERPAFVAIGGMSLRMPWLGGFAFDLTPRW